MYDKCRTQFYEFIKNHDTTDNNIKLKIIHTLKVVEQSEKIAKQLKLDKENIEIAKIIAILHDIGRFEQVKTTKTFNDSDKLNHADYGVKILFEENEILKYVDDSKYYNIIKKAIYNHNKLNIEENLSDLELLHCKIIRDADKIDNFRVKQTENLCNIFPGIYNKDTISFEAITDKVYIDFMENKCINVLDRKTQIDYWICVIAFIYDLNFKYSYIYIKDKKYIDVLVDKIKYNNLDTKAKMVQIKKHANEYINQKILYHARFS